MMGELVAAMNLPAHLVALIIIGSLAGWVGRKYGQMSEMFKQFLHHEKACEEYRKEVHDSHDQLRAQITALDTKLAVALARVEGLLDKQQR